MQRIPRNKRIKYAKILRARQAYFLLLSAAVPIIFFVVLGLFRLANNVNTTIGGSNLAGPSVSPTRLLTPTPRPIPASATATKPKTATATPSRTVTPSRTLTRTPTRTWTFTPTRLPTSTFAPIAATATVTKTIAVTPTITKTLALAPTRQPTVIQTSIAITGTPTTFVVRLPTLNATATATRALTTTPSPTAATRTATPSPSGSIQVALTQPELLIAPGDNASASIVITNTSSIPITVALATNDDQSALFTSSLSRTSVTLPARGSAATTLTVSADEKANGAQTNTTSIIATINGVERARATMTTRLLYVKFNRVLKGIGVADHNVSPSTRVDVQVGISAPVPLTSVTLNDFIPRAWAIADAGGGALSAVNPDSQKIEWSLGNLATGTIVTKTYTLTSPARSIPAPQYQFFSALANSNSKATSDPWSVTLEHPLTIARYRVGQNTPLDHMTYLAATDAPGGGIQPFDSFRVRFLVSNEQSSPVRWQPRLEWSARADGGFQNVPVGRGNAGQPFYIRALDEIQNRQTIPASLFGLGPTSRTAQNGLIFTSENPGPVASLNALSSTEIEFSLHSTLDAAYSTPYYYRLSDDTRLMPGKIAQIVMGAPPSPQLTQPQYAGIDPNANSRSSLARAAAPAASSPHGGYSNLADQCASCHRQHTSKNRNLLAYAPAQSNLCFACHNGTGASTNIASQYSDPNVPANNATTSSFYSHPATATTNHTSATNDEFRGVLNRHSECGDCHNPHSGDTSLATSTTSGFTVSGAMKNITGVDTNNTWKTVSAYEYELCYKCHSAYTTLLSYTKPSYKMLDQAAEFNPGNVSYHPIESAGKNNTTAMAASLAGTSPYKLWNFTVGSVVRCENCHGDYRRATPASPPAANARLAPHTSRFAYILMNNYRDRVLKSAGENYSAADFALCFQCHAEAPFTSGGGNSTATNFRLHSRHMTNIGGRSGSSTDIDTPGAGPGRAICAECHYRVHGQGINATGNPGGTRLVNFSPNITASSGGQLKWDPATRTCYMNCHGDNHNPERY